MAFEHVLVDAEVAEALPRVFLHLLDPGDLVVEQTLGRVEGDAGVGGEGEEPRQEEEVFGRLRGVVGGGGAQDGEKKCDEESDRLLFPGTPERRTTLHWTSVAA